MSLERPMLCQASKVKMTLMMMKMLVILIPEVTMAESIIMLIMTGVMMLW